MVLLSDNRTKKLISERMKPEGMMTTCIGVVSFYDKRNHFNFQITNFPFLSRSIRSLPVYGVLSHNFYHMPGLVPHMNVLF